MGLFKRVNEVTKLEACQTSALRPKQNAMTNTGFD